jgi:hypothetical protein
MYGRSFLIYKFAGMARQHNHMVIKNKSEASEVVRAPWNEAAATRPSTGL